MYLKALEIQGFKSFPDKTRLNFDQEITAIVGPNGSGKSNISDAILWVMGEQRTKTLRGGKMEDVIFGGTEKRSPMGFAQVSLILDNSTGIFDTENTEVMITRRYYRSGESEYKIDGEQVRRKDIRELFMDTGLGADGYSLVGQGKIDSIISAKNEDRRELFEEAAGISRFRHKRTDAQRRLEHGRADSLAQERSAARGGDDRSQGAGPEGAGITFPALEVVAHGRGFDAYFKDAEHAQPHGEHQAQQAEIHPGVFKPERPVDDALRAAAQPEVSAEYAGAGWGAPVKHVRFQRNQNGSNDPERNQDAQYEGK